MRSKRSWRESPPPTAATPRTDRATFGGDVADTMRMLGAEPMGWQVLVADRALEHEAGRLVHREVDLSTPRQVGKSTLILAVAVRRMLAQPGAWLTYTSASRLAARRKLLRVWWPMIRRSPLAEMFTVTKGTGSETLECRNGSVLVLLSGDDASGHGDSIDLSFLDEAWSLSEAAEQAVRPAQAARESAQLWVVSTAGTRKSVYWRSKVDAGRLAAEVDEDAGRCFVEWAAPLTVDVTDPETWPAFHPALGRTITADTLSADLASMSRLSEWRRAYANQWPDEATGAGWGFVPRELWEAAGP